MIYGLAVYSGKESVNLFEAEGAVGHCKYQDIQQLFLCGNTVNNSLKNSVRD